MKLATLKNDTPDGQLMVVNRSLTHAVTVSDIAPTLQWAIEHWATCVDPLDKIYQALNQQQLAQVIPFDVNDIAAPLPRAYQWLDGSAYLSHVERVRKARGAEMPASFLTDPLMYQGGSDDFISACDPIIVADPGWGVDLEAEVTIVTDYVPMGVALTQADAHIKLLMLINDVSLRNLIPAELAKGFGFIQGKPSSSFSPVAVTPDELGEAWHDNKIHLPLHVYVNDQLLGHCEAGDDMQFDFSQLIHHAAKTRNLTAGTIIGSGTVSNVNEANGCSCLVEKRVKEIIKNGSATTPFLKYGDRVSIEMLNLKDESIFGSIKQQVKPCQT